MGGRGRKSTTQGTKNDRVAGMLQKAFQELFHLGPGPGRSECHLPLANDWAGYRAPVCLTQTRVNGAAVSPFQMKKLRPWLTAITSLLGGGSTPSPLSDLTLDPFSSPHSLVGREAHQSPLQSSESRQGECDFLTPTITPLVWFSEEGLAPSWQGALEPGQIPEWRDHPRAVWEAHSSQGSPIGL